MSPTTQRSFSLLLVATLVALTVPLASAGDPDPLGITPAWTETGEFLHDQFGNEISTAGDVNADGYADVIVSAPVYGSDVGKVYLFLGSSSGLEVSASWTAVGEFAGDLFGLTISTAGDVNGDGYDDVVIGAPGFNNLGKVYVYHGSSVGLPASATWVVEGSVGDRTGPVATAGDVNNDGYSDILVGGTQGSFAPGKASVYLGGASGLAATPVWTVSGENDGDAFSSSLQTAGDVNGDGYSDVIIGAPGFAGITGKAYVYLGKADGVETTPVWTATGPTGQGQTTFAWSVSTVGDLNGDGYADIATGLANLQSVYIYKGGPGGPDATSTWTLNLFPTAPNFGDEVAAAGDVNGDGYSDLIVGAEADFSGKTYLFLGQSGGPAATEDWRAVGESGDDRFGNSVASAGDVNGDGASDVVVGALGVFFGGKAYAYHGILAPCSAPTDEVFITTVTLDGNGKPVLHFQDPNPPARVTGYNIYRAANPQGPWTLLELNAQDMDAITPDVQYTDASGDLGDLWYYEVAAWTATCSAEGPF